MLQTKNVVMIIFLNSADWDTFMNSEYLLNDTVVTWSVAQVSWNRWLILFLFI